MSSRKEKKEALRREREEREQSAREAQRRKRMVGIGAAGVLAVAALAVLVVLVAAGGDGGAGGGGGDALPDGGSVPEQRIADLEEAADAGGCELRGERGSGVATHTTDPAERVSYDTNPPTTGRHYQVPAEDGAYEQAPADTELVHTLEHGRVIVWFKPSLPEEQRADLKALFDEDTYQMVLVPRRNMPYAVAASAWNREPEPNGTGRLLVCDPFDPQIFDAIRTFRDEHRSNGPEPIP